MHVNLGEIDDTGGVKDDKFFNKRLHEIDIFELYNSSEEIKRVSDIHLF